MVKVGTLLAISLSLVLGYGRDGVGKHRFGVDRVALHTRGGEGGQSSRSGLEHWDCL